MGVVWCVGIGLWSKSGQGAVERDRVFISEVTALVTARRTTCTHTHYVYYYQPVSLSLYGKTYTLLSPAIVPLSSLYSIISVVPDSHRSGIISTWCAIFPIPYWILGALRMQLLLTSSGGEIMSDRFGPHQSRTAAPWERRVLTKPVSLLICASCDPGRQ